MSATVTQGVVDPAFHFPDDPSPAVFRRWSLLTLPAGASETLTLVERVTSLGPLTNEAFSFDVGLHTDFDGDNNVAVATVEVQPTADLSVTKRVSHATPTVGDTITFTVTVTNSGPGEATGVQVSDGLPAGLTLVSSTPSQGTYSPDTSVWEVEGLASGAAATLALAARVEQAGEVTNVATRTVAEQFDPDPSNNAGGVTLTGQPSADIQVLQTIDNPAPNVDDTVTLTLTVRNAGPSDATGVQVTDLLPAGLTLVSATPSQGMYTADTGVWDIVALAQGASVTLAIVATVTQAGRHTILASKTAQGEEDPVESNNASGVTLNGHAADVQVLKTVDVNAPLVGHTVTFTVTVINRGPSAATGVVVTEQVPVGVTVLAATPSQGTYAAATGGWTVGTLANSGAGATATLQVAAQVSQAGDWTNLATRTAHDQADPNPLNDHGTATIRVPFPVPPPPPPEANAPPVAIDDEVPTPVDGPVTIAVLGNDRDPDSDPLTVVAVTQPLGGTVVLNPDGTLTYTPHPGFRGPDTFTYTLSDRHGRTATGTVRVSVVVLPVSPGPAPPVVPPPVGPGPELPVGPGPGPAVLAPPAGRKTVETTGLPALAWQVVWLNPNNAAPLRLGAFDPIPAATTYVDGSVTCVARGQSTVERCAFEAATNQVVADAILGPDPGATSADQAANEVVITFQTTVLPGVTQVANQALAHWDTDETGSVDDDIDAGQVPVRTGTAVGQDDPTVVPLPPLACLFQHRLLALTVPASGPVESGGAATRPRRMRGSTRGWIGRSGWEPRRSLGSRRPWTTPPWRAPPSPSRSGRCLSPAPRPRSQPRYAWSMVARLTRSMWWSRAGARRSGSQRVRRIRS